MNFQRTFILLVLILSFSCKDIKKNGTINSGERPFIIGHRAAGNAKYGSKLIGNSFEAVKFGYKYFDGIEVDVQMSKDSTLWLIHDDKIVNCDHDTVAICELSDKQILEINSCKDGTIITLEQLFSYLSGSGLKKIVSLDMKCVNNDYCVKNHPEEYKRIIADQLTRLYNKYKLDDLVAIESWDAGFLGLVEEQSPKIESFLLVWSKLKHKDLLYAKKINIDGLSCRIDDGVDKNMILEANVLNIKIQLWTANNKDDIENCLELNPFVIQTDNVEYFIEQ